ncbi:MAG: cryptochrome/photolyase family protein [Acidimicrobiia bacterium]|nr:cryptochrome/photolyase family protein [Acidimicrobiia bacterium]
MQTIWVLGDQLNRSTGALASARPGTHRVLLVESAAKLGGHAWHRQRAHLVLSAMRRFAAELTREGFQVDYRRAGSLDAGLKAHRADYGPEQVVAAEPTSWEGLALLRRRGVQLVPTDQFLCHPGNFAAWANGRRRLRMDDFYRWQRRRLGLLMEGDEPQGGRWSFDTENRRPPPRHGTPWPVPKSFSLDDLDRAVLADLPSGLWGEPPQGWWPASRSQARERLASFCRDFLPHFGPHQDAMLQADWHLAHSLLSPALNLGLLRPQEVIDAALAAHRLGGVPLPSLEGFLRQIVGWREYVWGLYWLWMPGYRDENALEAHLPLPPAFRGAPTTMNCVAQTISGLRRRAYAHHIQRLMVLGNLALTAGVEPREMVLWMRTAFVDGAEWVMIPNVIGMALHADGGRMATKPYAASGRYLQRMSNYCTGCRFDPGSRVGPSACPFTTLYWDFLDRHRNRFSTNPRLALALRSLERLDDLPEVRRRAEQVRRDLSAGNL